MILLNQSAQTYRAVFHNFKKYCPNLEATAPPASYAYDVILLNIK